MRSRLTNVSFAALPQVPVVIGLLLLLCSHMLAQDTETRIPARIVPPPLNLISKEERKALDALRSRKKRTKTAIEFIENRLVKSEEKIAKRDYQGALNQLGRFQALIRDTYVYLKRYEDRRGSFRNFKRFEISLRHFLPRLELLRRKMPFEYAYQVRKLIEFVRDARSNSLDPLFDDTVVPEKKT